MNTDGYATDLSDEQWKMIERLLPAPKTRGRPQPVSRRRVLDAIFNLGCTGCQWRMLPKDSPHWKTVSNLFYQWRKGGCWQPIHDALATRVRKANSRKPSPTVAVLDSQSVKTTEMGDDRGFDAGKKTLGRKRKLGQKKGTFHACSARMSLLPFWPIGGRGMVQIVWLIGVGALLT